MHQATIGMFHHNHRTHFQQIVEDDDAAQGVGIDAAAGVADGDGVSDL